MSARRLAGALFYAPRDGSPFSVSGLSSNTRKGAERMRAEGFLAVGEPGPRGGLRYVLTRTGRLALAQHEGMLAQRRAEREAESVRRAKASRAGHLRILVPAMTAELAALEAEGF